MAELGHFQVGSVVFHVRHQLLGDENRRQGVVDPGTHHGVAHIM